MKLDVQRRESVVRFGLYAAGSLGPFLAIALLATIPAGHPAAALVHVGGAIVALAVGLIALVETQRLALSERARGRCVVVGARLSRTRSALGTALATVVLALLVSAVFEAVAIAREDSARSAVTAGERALEEAISRREGGAEDSGDERANGGRPARVVGPNARERSPGTSAEGQVGDLLSGAEVLQVRPLGAPRRRMLGAPPQHLRGFVIDSFDRDGRLRERRSKPVEIESGVDGARVGWVGVANDAGIPATDVQLEVRFVARPNGLVFAPSRLLAIRGSTVMYDREQASFSLPAEESASYVVRSAVPAVSLGQLRSSRAAGTLGGRAVELPRTRGVRGRREYLQRMRAYSELVTERAETDADRVLAIVRHLRETFGYEIYDTSFLRPEDFGAFVERGAGSCTHFASVAVYLLRLQSIPARIAVGYVAREVDPDGRGWIVRERDGHAWIEVHFEGLGWLPFDPTPGDPSVGGTSSAWTPLAGADEVEIDLEALAAAGPRTAPAGRLLVDAWEALSRRVGGGVEAALTLLAAIALIAVLVRLGSTSRGPSPSTHASDRDTRVAAPDPAPPSAAVAGLLGALGERGWRQGSGRTPTAFARETEAQHDEARGLGSAIRVVLRRACTGRAPTDAEERALEGLTARIRARGEGERDEAI
ncbi:MAG: transglutaminase-like domain-containing protein [Planctomycetota bacterium]